MKARIKKKPSNAAGIISAAKKALSRKPKVMIGLPSASSNYPDGTSVVMVGTAHEFGLGVPERSFLRSTMIGNKQKYSSLVKRGGAKILSGDENINSLMGKIGQIIESDVKSRIVAIKSPPNTDQTIANKKSSNPLIDTGHMLGQIKYLVEL